MYPPFCALVAVICSCDVHIKFLLRVIFILHASLLLILVSF